MNSLISRIVSGSVSAIEFGFVMWTAWAHAKRNSGRA
jgi:hypothetical protein